jgi:hypothetical protein
MDDKNFFNYNNLNIMNEFPFELYKNISLDELVTYCVFLVLQEKKEATFESVVAKCFELFPQKYSLIGYPQWPDSARVNKAWLRCRTDCKYISGSVKNGFSITSKGLEIIEGVQKKLNRPFQEQDALRTKKGIARSREEQFINELEKSDVFKRYIVKRENTEISHFELCDVLYCTLESSAKSLNNNLDMLKEFATKLNKKDILSFLLLAEKRFASILRGGDMEEKYSGGMNKRRN